MICKKCGTDNGHNVGKCAKCGAKLSSGGEKENMFDFSVSSVLIIIFSLIAVVCLLLPDTRSISAIEIISGAPDVQEETAVDLLNTIKKDQSIANEKEKIDKNIAILQKDTAERNKKTEDMFVKTSWTPDEAIEVLEQAKNSPNVDISDRIAGIKERIGKVEAKNQEISTLTAEIAPDEASLNDLNNQMGAIASVMEECTNEAYIKYLVSQEEADEEKLKEKYPIGTEDNKTKLDEKILDDLSNKIAEMKTQTELLEEKLREPYAKLAAMQQELTVLEQELSDYVMESINSLHEDDVDRGALSGVVREHRSMQPMMENMVLVFSIVTMICFIITIIAWATRMYRLRLITVIADLVMAIATFFVPLMIWSVEFKWPQKVFGNITYGFNFGSTYIFVLICAIAVIAAGFAYFSDIFSAQKTNG